MEGELGARISTAETGEIMDEIITRSRGEIKHICSPKITSSTSTPLNDPKNLQSPRFPQKAYSPRVYELRGQPSAGRGALSPTGDVRPSHLGKSPQSKLPT